MTWSAFVLAALKALPAFISLVARIKASAEAKINQGIGYQKAVADAIEESRAQLAAADQAVEEARTRQAAHPNDDAGRDTQFRRD